MDNVLHLIGLCHRAGALSAGEEPTGAACRAKDCRLILLAGDAADNTCRRARHFAEAGQCLWLSLPYSREELGAVSARGACAMAAVTDIGFACAIARRLAEADGQRYGETAGRLEEKARRARQRREARKARDRKPRRGGREAKPFVPARVKGGGRGR